MFVKKFFSIHWTLINFWISLFFFYIFSLQLDGIAKYICKCIFFWLVLRYFKALIDNFLSKIKMYWTLGCHKPVRVTLDILYIKPDYILNIFFLLNKKNVYCRLVVEPIQKRKLFFFSSKLVAWLLIFVNRFIVFFF